VGLPSRDEALRAQRRNLERFVEEQRELYAQMPYEPWTDQTRKFGVKTKLGISALPGCQGLRAVRLEAAVTTGDKAIPLLYYPGLLMTEQMYALFHAKYHCPTALEVPALGYEDSTRTRHEVLIVGDPTSHGAIINDGVHSGKAGQAHSGLRLLDTHKDRCSIAHTHLGLHFLCFSQLQVAVRAGRCPKPRCKEWQKWQAARECAGRDGVGSAGAASARGLGAAVGLRLQLLDFGPRRRRVLRRLLRSAGQRRQSSHSLRRAAR
jgi:hypothetical protein